MGSRSESLFGIGREAPEQLVEGLAVGVELPRRLGVRDRGLDLLAVPDDARVRDQPLEVLGAVGRDLLDVEAVERLPEVLPLAQNGQPGEARLKRLQGKPLEKLGLAM